MTATAERVSATCGHTSDVPAQLCPGCSTRLRDQLSRLPGLYTALAAWLPPAGRRPELGHATAAEAPLPARQEVLDLRGPGGIVGILEDWRSALHEARGFTEPTRAGDIPARVERSAAALLANLTWVSLTWDLATELAGEIARLEGRCVAVINPLDQSVPIGPCPCDLGDGRICGTTIRVPAGTQTVRCRGCGTSFPPEAWLNLRRWMDADRGSVET